MAPNESEKQLGTLPKIPYTRFMLDLDKVLTVHLWCINMGFTHKRHVCVNSDMNPWKTLKNIFFI